MNLSGYVNDPAFVRGSRGFWEEAPSDLMLPENHHSHDRAWLISIFHGIETKQHGAEFKPPEVIMLGVQRERWMAAYNKTYANTLESNAGDFNKYCIARRAANSELTRRITNIKARN